MFLSTTWKSWSEAVCDDLEWLCGFPMFDACRGKTMSEWIAMVAANAKAFKKKVMKVCKMPFANVMGNWATCKSLSDLGGTFSCISCNKSFKSKQSLSLHKFKAHGIKSIERRYVEGSRCPVCLLEMWTRERLLNHVKRCKTCNENLLMRPPVLTSEQADALDMLDRESFAALRAQGLRRHAAKKPCVQASGPFQLPIIVDPDCFSQHHPLGRGHNIRL